METEPVESNADNRGSGSPRYLLLSLAALALIAVSVVLLLQVFVVERIPDLTEARLDAAEQLWEKKGPANYDLDVEIRGAQPGIVHMEVRNGQPAAMTRDGRVPPEHTWDTWTVPGMFVLLEREMVLAEDPQHEMDVPAGAELRLRCEFDPEFGYPQRYHRHSTGGAPEVYFRVTDFQVR